jgi:hypothetical protein
MTATITVEGKVKYALLGDIISNHLKNYTKKIIETSLYGTASLDEAEEENPRTEAPKNIKNTKTDYEIPRDVENIKDTDCHTCANFIESKGECKIKLIPPGKVKDLKGQCSFYKRKLEPGEIKESEAIKYIPTRTLNAPRLLLHYYDSGKLIRVNKTYKIGNHRYNTVDLHASVQGKSVIINLNHGYINIGTESFTDDLVDRIILEEQAGKVYEALGKIRNGKLRQKIFLCELLYGYVKPRQYKLIAEVLNIETRKVERNITKIFEVKEDIEYKELKEFLKSRVMFNGNLYKWRELEQHYKATKKARIEGYGIETYWIRE